MKQRPLLRYHGGKWVLAPWIISHFPEHKVYTEAFGGAGSVLLQKQRSYAEVYNDLDSEVVNLFRVVRDHGAEIVEKLLNTPFSRKEFELSYQNTEDQIEQARRTVIRSFMGFGSAGASGQKTGFRSNSNRSGTTPAADWKNYPEHLDFIITRLQGVVIENRTAIEVMMAHDSKNTLHYLDPPYILSTRSKGEKTKSYKFEMRDIEHETLLTEAKKMKGIVVISGYENDLYNDHLSGWLKSKRTALADGAKKRTEVVWINKNFMPQQQLF